jgi:hypothetical protein
MSQNPTPGVALEVMLAVAVNPSWKLEQQQVQYQAR